MGQNNLTIPNLFQEAAAKFPQKTALRVKKDNLWIKFTYRDLQERILKVATFLSRQGFKKGDFAALFLENRPEWSEIYLGIVCAGLTCVPLDYQLNAEEIKNLILDSKAKLLFCSEEALRKSISSDIRRILNKIVVVDLKESEKKDCVDFCEIDNVAPEDESLVQVQPEDIASLIYTSGTTDRPKGVLLTHKNICSNFVSISLVNLIFPTDNFISILPLHHTYPFMITLIVPLFSGATITFCPLGFKPQDLLGIIKEAEVTVLVAVPQLLSLIYNAISEKIIRIPFILRFLLFPFIKVKIRTNFGKDLRLLVSGGARLEPKIAKSLCYWGLKTIEGYGLTETSPVVTFNPPQKLKFGSVGKPLPDVQIKIINADNRGVGEVLIKGPNVMQGYFREPELTSSIIKEGWFHSGDLGYIDKEGYLFITGREKEVIVLSSGKTIYPDELETYYSQTSYIKEICILQKSQEAFGHWVESLYAVVVPDLDFFRLKNEANIRAKISWELENLAKKLPPYKHIMGFAVTKEELPRTALRKLKRYAVREKYLAQKPAKIDMEKAFLSEEDRKILKQDSAQKIIDYISHQLKKPVYLDSLLEIDLGIDSLSRVELGLGLESIFSVKIPDEFLYTVSTVKEVILKISELVSAPSKAAEISRPLETPQNWAQILKEMPSREIINEIRLKPNIFDYLITAICKTLFLFLFRVFWLLRIKGENNLPIEPPYIICPNHASYLDGFIVFCSLPFKLALNSYFLGYSAIFRHPTIRWAIKLARLIPIDPNMQLTEAMQAVSFVLSHKKAVCIFPEGRRSIDENIQEFKKGVGILIKELDIPALPLYIKGSHQSWPRGNRLPRFYPLKVIFGQPLLAKELLERREHGQDDYEIIARNLREEVRKLA